MNRENRVLRKEYQVSSNFYDSDKILQHYLYSRLSASALAYMDERLRNLGEKAAGEMNDLSLAADKQGPKLRKRNFLGENVDQIDFHPAYQKLQQIY